jgi:hypothetical protein
MAVQRTVLYPFVFHTPYVTTYHCHKNKSVFGYEGRSTDFGVEAQNLKLKQKMAVAMSKKTTPTNLSGNHTCIISGLS